MLHLDRAVPTRAASQQKTAWARCASLSSPVDGSAQCAPFPPYGASSPGAEKILEELRRMAFGDAAIHFRPVVAGRRGEEPHAVLHRAALGIGGGVIEPADARKRHGGGAHGAGLERDVEVTVGEALRAERGGGGADRQELGVRGRIA